MNDQEWEIAPDSLPEAESGTQFKSTMYLSARQIKSSNHPFREWENGPLSHLTGLAIPHPAADHGFRFSATGHLFDGLLSAKVYCDSLTGVSGNDRDHDPRRVQATLSDDIRHGLARGRPGQMLRRSSRRIGRRDADGRGSASAVVATPARRRMDPGQ